jgi:hypothetical protein
MTVPLLALWLLAAIDPCASRLPGRKKDPATASAYLSVGREEESRGALKTAKLAYAEAVASDPSNAQARSALRRLCAEPVSPPPSLDAALEKLSAGDRDEALRILERLREKAPSASAALLEGILNYELERDAQAEPLLRSAEADPSTADSAKLFLGLIALRKGDADSALSQFRALSNAPDATLRSSAASLLRLAAREGRLVLSGTLEGGYDSNTDVTPGTQLLSSSAAAGLGGAALSALIRPWLQAGPFLLLRGGYRAIPANPIYELGSAAGALGFQLGDGDLRGAAEYQLDLVALGLHPYLLTHSLLVRGQVPLGRALLFAELGAYLETYIPSPPSIPIPLLTASEAAGYSGVRPAGRGTARWRFSPELFAELEYGLSRDLAGERRFSYLEHGPGVRARWSLTSQLSLSTAAEYRTRAFDAPDPDLLLTRADTYVNGGLRAEYELSPSWALFASLWGWQASSNVPELSYLRLVGTAGFSFTEGFQ